MEIEDQNENEDILKKFSSSNVNADELDQETNTKLRGDAIGDTLYSQSFVLKTLLQFSNLTWNEELENDLCFLWDMTIEKDVCEYLFEVSFPSLACTALEKYTENRFIEIVVGVLANILCADCEKSITEDEVNVVLKELETDDHLILIQIVRFISALTCVFTDSKFISDSILDKLIFILYNSTNSDLLVKTLEAMSKITDEFKVDKNLINIEIVKSSLTAYKSVVYNIDEFDLNSKDKGLACKYMLTICSNICAYIEEYNMSELALQFKANLNIFMNEIVHILNWFSFEENLIPVTDEFIFYMSVLRFIVGTLGANYLSDIFFPLSKILYIISDFKNDVSELFETLVELECYLFSQTTPELLYEDFRRISSHKALRVLSIINENKQNFNLNFDLQYISDKLADKRKSVNFQC